jgi:hypothetical protein
MAVARRPLHVSIDHRAQDLDLILPTPASCDSNAARSGSGHRSAASGVQSAQAKDR